MSVIWMMQISGILNCETIWLIFCFSSRSVGNELQSTEFIIRLRRKTLLEQQKTTSCGMFQTIRGNAFGSAPVSSVINSRNQTRKIHKNIVVIQWEWMMKIPWYLTREAMEDANRFVVQAHPWLPNRALTCW